MTNEPVKTPIIQMHDVSAGPVDRPEAVTVEHVELTVNSGDFWVVAGMHETGKTDFLMMTAGLTAPVHGTYRFMGEEMPISEEQIEHRLRIGVVFETGQLLKQLTVAENITLPLLYHRDSKDEDITAQVDHLLEVTELQPWANNTPGTLPRLWHKRASLARAVALQPEVLLLDNPLNGVDLRHGGWWLKFLDELSAGHEIMPDKRPTTLIVTANDFRPWTNAKQFAVLEGGRFTVLSEKPQLTRVDSAYVKELLAEEIAKR